MSECVLILLQKNNDYGNCDGVSIPFKYQVHAIEDVNLLTDYHFFMDCKIIQKPKKSLKVQH